MARVVLSEGHGDLLAKASIEVLPGVLICGIRIVKEFNSEDLRVLWPTRLYVTPSGAQQIFRIVRPTRFDDLTPIQALEDEILDAYEAWHPGAQDVA
jgi:hypothetical protein